MFFLAPSLARLLDAAEQFGEGHVPAESVLELFPSAFEFCNESTHLFRLLSAGVLRTDEVARMLGQAKLELESQSEALARLRQAVEEGKPVPAQEQSERLKAASSRLLELYGQVQQAEAQEKIYSPFPPIDHFIKVGMNHLNDFVEALELNVRLASVVAELNQIGSRIERFRLFYGEGELDPMVSQAFQGLQAGVGAASDYLSTRKRASLEDGLRLLGSSSVILANFLQQFDQQASQRRSNSSLPFLDQFLKAVELHRQEKIGEELVRQCWSEVEEVCVFYQRQLASLARSALYTAVVEEWEQARQSWTRLRDELVKVGASLEKLPPEDFPQDSVESAFQDLLGKIEPLFKKVENEAGKLRHMPALEGLREVIARAEKGELSPRQFGVALEDYQKRQQELVAQLQRKPNDPVNQEMVALLTTHSAAFAALSHFVEDPRPDHLRTGWMLIEGSLARLGELGEQLAKRVKPRSTGPKTINCLRCGSANPVGKRICQNCGANLPAVVAAPVETVDITASGQDGGLGDLDAVLDAAEAGTISRQELLEQIDDLLIRADDSRRTFEKKLIPLMGQNGELDAYLRFFAEGLGAYVHGLMQVRGFAEGQGVSHLMSGAAQAREAAEGLEAMRTRIQEAVSSR